MNGRQAAREAAKRIADLENVNARLVQDVKDYNACILSLISGDSACLYCEERPECQREVKDGGKGLLGCSEWWLRYRKEIQVPGEAGDPDGGKEETAVLGMAEQ